MPRPLELDFTQEQRRQLEDLRAHAPKPYVRERAAALLKVADGMSARHVAAHGLLRRHWHRTIGRWAERFLAEGPAGLLVRSGRGRKPAFFPSLHDASAGAAGRARRRAPRA
jgi:hypothetical protein